MNLVSWTETICLEYFITFVTIRYGFQECSLRNLTLLLIISILEYHIVIERILKRNLLIIKCTIRITSRILKGYKTFCPQIRYYVYTLLLMLTAYFKYLFYRR